MPKKVMIFLFRPLLAAEDGTVLRSELLHFEKRGIAVNVPEWHC